MHPIRDWGFRQPIVAGISAGLTIVVAGAALVVGGTVLNTMLERHEEHNAQVAERTERERQANVVRAFVACSRDALNTEDYLHRMAEIAREALENAERCADSPGLDFAMESLGIVTGPNRTIDEMLMMKFTGAERPRLTVPARNQAYVERLLKTFQRVVDLGRNAIAVRQWRMLRDYLLEFPDDLKAALETTLAVE